MSSGHVGIQRGTQSGKPQKKEKKKKRKKENKKERKNQRKKGRKEGRKKERWNEGKKERKMERRKERKRERKKKGFTTYFFKFCVCMFFSIFKIFIRFYFWGLRVLVLPGSGGTCLNSQHLGGRGTWIF